MAVAILGESSVTSQHEEVRSFPTACGFALKMELDRADYAKSVQEISWINFPIWASPALGNLELATLSVQQRP